LYTTFKAIHLSRQGWGVGGGLCVPGRSRAWPRGPRAWCPSPYCSVLRAPRPLAQKPAIQTTGYEPTSPSIQQVTSPSTGEPTPRPRHTVSRTDAISNPALIWHRVLCTELNCNTWQAPVLLEMLSRSTHLQARDFLGQPYRLQGSGFRVQGSGFIPSADVASCTLHGIKLQHMAGTSAPMTACLSKHLQNLVPRTNADYRDENTGVPR